MKIITITDARALGLKRYFTGIPCRHGHVCERGVASRACCECNCLAQREPRSGWNAWHLRNPARFRQSRKERRKRYRLKHPEKRAAECRRYRERHPEKCAQIRSASEAKRAEYYRFRRKDRDQKARAALRALNEITKTFKTSDETRARNRAATARYREKNRSKKMLWDKQNKDRRNEKNKARMRQATIAMIVIRQLEGDQP